MSQHVMTATLFGGRLLMSFCKAFGCKYTINYSTIPQVSWYISWYTNGEEVKVKPEDLLVKDSAIQNMTKLSLQFGDSRSPPKQLNSMHVPC